MTLPRQRANAHSAELAKILRSRLVKPHFQPIVHLATGTVVGYEALARGPVDSPLHTPDALFAAARADGLLADLDRLCQARAIECADSANLRDPLSLFINIEPEVAGELPPLLAPSGLPAAEGLRVIVEFTERSLTARPAELLALADDIRRRGWGIALDDVGADPASLALMPFLQPDVIKLDLRLIHDRPDAAAAEIMAAVTAHAERTGASILAEGIETAAHVAVAQAYGASLGQGWHYGRPSQHVEAGRHASGPNVSEYVPLSPPRQRDARRASLFEVAARHRPSKRSTKPLLISVSKMLERQALKLDATAVIIGAFEHARYFENSTSGRYQALAERLAFVGALGADIDLQPAPGVRGARLSDYDPVRGEWHVVLVSPHFHAALVARDLGDNGPEDDRRFDYVLTYDADVVLRMADGLLARIVPSAVRQPIETRQY